MHVRAEDTDILVMLVHHIPRCPNVIQMITKSDTYSIMDIRNKLTDVEKDRLLFVHSFTGCDIVSGIYRHSKKGLLQKLCKTDEDLVVRFGTLLSLEAPKQEIIDAGIYLFQLIYGDPKVSLAKHRYNKYYQMTATSKLRPEGLPPSEGAATQHVLRAYLQYRDWQKLESMTLPPTEFGWFLDSNGTFAPVITHEEIAPTELLNLTACKCKTGCKSNKCGCRKLGMKCIPACGTCHGTDCTNADIENEDTDAEENEDEDETDTD